FDRHAGLGFAQDANDLFFGKALLHVPSHRDRELGSKRRCYSKSGGRRIEQRLYNPPRKILGFKTPGGFNSDSQHQRL
ncbi:hypothetical protein, partial [Xanthomonas oryzae]